MTDEGFYRITMDGFPGIGVCQHYESAVRGETYEDWRIMYVRTTPGGQPAIMNTMVNSTDKYFGALVVGEPIDGLPTDFSYKRV